jgi:WD40 repeat protein
MTTPSAGGEPSHVGRFEVRDRLQGGTPTVYRGYDPRFDRDVTLTLDPCRGDDATAQVDRLIRRHKAALELRHPAILPAYEVGQSDGWCYVASGFVDGPRLAETLADGPLPIRRAAVIARELADGLAYAHERGFVHGAVHPSGVVVSDDGSAVWLDFGTDASDPPANPAYAAPERLGDPPGPADTASDQYGLGVLLFAMLTGDPPHVGDDEEVVARVLAADKAPSPRHDRRDVPKDLDAVCRKALAPDPADRYRTSAEFADDLRRWLEGAVVVARPRRAKWFVIAGLLLLFALGSAGVGGLAWMQVRRVRQAEMYARALAESERDRAEASRLAELDARRKAEKEESALRGQQVNAAKTKSKVEEERDLARKKVQTLEAKLKTEKDKADATLKKAERERERLEQALYAQSILQSYRAWRDRDPGRARTLLEAGRPADKRPDNRGWEWFYLQRLYHPPQTFTYKAEGSRLAGTEPRAADGIDLRRYSCAFNADGSQLAISLFDDRVTVWNTLFGGVAVTVEGHEGAVCDVAYSPDGKLLATGGADKLVRLWDAATGEPGRKLRGHDDAVLAVAFAPDGQSLASAGADHAVIIWETAGAKKHTLKGHEGAVLAVAFSTDGTTLATADAVGAVRLWDAAAGEAKTTIAAHSGPAYGLAFSPDGQRLATAGGDRVVKLWDAKTGQEQRVLSGPVRPLRSVAFRPDGRRLAAAGDDMTVSQWDLGTTKLTAFITGHTAPIHRVAYRPDGKQLATASADGTLKLWDPDHPTGLDDTTFRGHADAVNAVAVSPNGRRLATGGQDKTVKLWDARTGEVTRTLEGHTAPVRAVAFSADGRTLATAGDDKSAKLWDVATGQVQRTVSGHTDAILGVALSPDGKKLATASRDGTARIRDTETGQALITLRGHNAAVVGVQFSHDGRRVLTSGGDGSARLWDVATGRELASATDRPTDRQVTTARTSRRPNAPPGPSAYPARAVYSPDGRWIAFAGRDGGLLLYHTAGLWVEQTLEGHDGLVRCLAFSPDGERLATGDAEGVVKVWDTRTGSEVLSLPAHDGGVTGIAFSPDGDVLYTAGADKTARAWDGTPMEGRPKKRPKDDREKAKDDGDDPP